MLIVSRMLRAMPLIYRVICFMLLAMVCFIRYFSLTQGPADGGSSGPGDGLLLFFDLILSNIIILPLCLVLWDKGFRQVHYRKTALIFGFLVIDWPLLLLACLAAFSFFDRT